MLTNGIVKSEYAPGLEPAEHSNESSALELPPISSSEDIGAAKPTLREPIIEGIVRRGETINLIAAPKTGKSWLAIDLGLAVATGRKWLGNASTQRGDVLLIDNELHRETLAHRIHSVRQAREISVGDSAGFFYSAVRGRGFHFGNVDRFFDGVGPGQFQLIVLDAYYRFIPPGHSENDNAQVASLYNRIDGWAEELDCAFVLIHHSTKGDQAGKAITDVGAGAGSQSRAADSHLVIRPHECAEHVVLDAVTRSFKPIQPTTLKWTFPVWNAVALEPRLKIEKGRGDQRQENRDAEGVRLIVDWLEQQGEARSRKAIRDGTGISHERLTRLIPTAVRRGEIELARTETKRKQEVQYYQRSGWGRVGSAGKADRRPFERSVRYL